MVSEETTKECNGINLSRRKIFIYGEVSRNDNDGDEDNIVLFAGAIEEKVQC